RLFREHSTPEENWLIPDTVQDPPSLIVHRISTTNLGLLLNARLAAMDLGFFTLPEFISDTEKSFEAIDRMPRMNGQLFNWYDTRTVEPVKPRFVSSVDNGNLVCCLWTLKQGCLGALNAPLFPHALWSGILNHLEVLEDILQKERWDERLTLVQRLKRRARSLGYKLERWAEALPELERDAIVLDKALSHAGGQSAWWGHEICLRFTHLQALILDFAPWFAPEFAKHISERDLLNITRSELVTLKSLPRICASLERKLDEV